MQLQFNVRQNDELNRKTLMLNNKEDCFYIQFYCLVWYCLITKIKFVFLLKMTKE